MFRAPTDLMEYSSEVTIESVFYGMILLGVLWVAYKFLLEFIFFSIGKISEFIKKFFG